MLSNSFTTISLYPSNFNSSFQTLDTYDLSEKLSAAAGQDKAEVERITDEFIREQANLEFIDDTVSFIKNFSAKFYFRRGRTFIIR